MNIASESLEELSATKRALLAIKELQARLEALEQAKHEPIAIVGMGCRFPGGADDPEALWSLLRDRVDAITEVPSDRWSLDRHYSADPHAPGKMYSRYGGFLPHWQDCDAQFFRISPREAISLDPQQRLLLEVSWEAIEQAGLAPEQLVQSQTGVFIGICSIDYWSRLLAQNPSAIDAYLTTGNTHSIASGRLSYLLGLTGPSLSVDTACASSLVAVHLACQSLRQRECDLALAGGVNRILSPESSINFSKARMLSADGRCRSFDAAANGFGRAEGCGVIVLKRLNDAIASQDLIFATILGSAVNHDGRTSSLTVPNGPAQQAVIRQALQNSRVEPSQVSYVETHGTGTALGDPIEVNALGQVFGDRPPTEPLAIGSVKTNLGHTEAAAGMAGLIKTVLALQHAEIPANLHFQTPNPHIGWSDLPIHVPSHSLPWPPGTTPRIAGISAFGFSGTNAHVVLSDFSLPLPTSLPPPSADRPLHLLTLSARTEAALQQLARRYANHLSVHADLPLADVCFTANTGRSHFNQRLAIVAASLSELSTQLAAYTAGQNPEGLFQGRVKPDHACYEISVALGSETAAKTIDLSLSEELGTQLAALRLDRQAWQQVLYHLAQVYVQGASVHWAGFDRPYPRRKVVLPTYPFQRQRYGIELT